MEAIDPSLNALVARCYDDARRQSREADLVHKRGGPLGPLHGVPVTIKECFHVAGTMATLGVSQEWWPHTNVAAVIFDGASYYREVPDVCFQRGQAPEGVDCRQMGRVELGQAAVYLGSFLVLAVALSLGSFRRRDVP